LWITNQTEYEFLKHRQRVKNRPEELYRELKELYFPVRHLKSFLNQYHQLKSRTAKDSRHPYINPKLFEAFDKSLEELNKQTESLEAALTKEIDQSLKDHMRVVASDPLLKFFHVTRGYTFEELLNIIKEGEFRYRNKIPPGYADHKKKEELGVAKYGDFVIWKQIIGLAKKTKLPVILVIDDIKEDWCFTDKKEKSRIDSPREELIKEIKDAAGVPFWSYTSSQFLFKASEILKSAIKADAIDEVRKVVQDGHTIDIEIGVLDWVKTKFNAVRTDWGKDFCGKDTGADIIQTLDGALFSVQIDILDENTTVRDLRSIMNSNVEHIVSLGLKLEGQILVLVNQDRKQSGAIKRIIASSLPKFDIYIGYVDESGDFIEENTDPFKQ
jgi:hypothetical protein